jgi:hypothetical protein
LLFLVGSHPLLLLVVVVVCVARRRKKALLPDLGPPPPASGKKLKMALYIIIPCFKTMKNYSLPREIYDEFGPVLGG